MEQVLLPQPERSHRLRLGVEAAEPAGQTERRLQNCQPVGRRIPGRPLRRGGVKGRTRRAEEEENKEVL